MASDEKQLVPLLRLKSRERRFLRGKDLLRMVRTQWLIFGLSFAFLVLFQSISAFIDGSITEVTIELALFFAMCIAVAFPVAVISFWPQRRSREKWRIEIAHDKIQVFNNRKKFAGEMHTSEIGMVYATHETSPFKNDVELNIVANDLEKHIDVPLVAEGGEDFLHWLSTRDGFMHEAVDEAMKPASFAVSLWQSEKIRKMEEAHAAEWRARHQADYSKLE